jgi:hypothetical protein
MQGRVNRVIELWAGSRVFYVFYAAYDKIMSQLMSRSKFTKSYITIKSI